jgi:triacylglycerol lipase
MSTTPSSTPARDLALLARAGEGAAGAARADRPLVVLLHGLARTRFSLSGLAGHLQRTGFATWSRTYPSRQLSIAASAEQIADAIARELPAGRPLAAVTHSLGGILLRHVAQRITFTRVVMLAPPNRGSRLSRALRDRPIYRWFFGEAGQELAEISAVSEVEPELWPALPPSTAVIAGTGAKSSWNPTGWVSRSARVFAPGEPNDGTLAVAETQIDGMAAFATVDASHSWIMNHPAARALVVRFLDVGTLD